MLVPKAIISLDYPNRWDINSQIALTNDGSRLIDASRGARNIRVWDWQNNRVVQRLQLNDKASTGYEDVPHDLVLGAMPGQELTLSPDGRYLVACTSLSKGILRVWNLETGAIVTDIPYLHRQVPGQDPEKIFGLGCDSIGFSPDGRHLSLLNFHANLYADETDLAEIQAVDKINMASIASSLKAGKIIPPPIKAKAPTTYITGIAIFSTDTWKLERLLFRPGYRQPRFNSRPQFDADSRALYAAIFDQAPVGVWNTWVGNRIVRWDVATGAQLDERDMPQLVKGEEGLWWRSITGTDEVWWENRATSPMRTEQDIDQCRQFPHPATATFESDVAEDCAHIWLLTVLNQKTGKTTYLVPHRKYIQAELSDKSRYAWAWISPDGRHIVRVQGTREIKKGDDTVEIFNRQTMRLEGRYTSNFGLFSPPAFSSDSRYLAFAYYKPNFLRASYGRELAVILEIPDLAKEPSK